MGMKTLQGAVIFPFTNFPASKQLIFIVLFCFSCTACTNSKLILRPLYNSFDDRFEDRFLAYADFDQEQVQRIQDLADHFHLWHRQTQLESYRLLLAEFSNRLNDPEDVLTEDVKRWSNTLTIFTSNVGSCNPIDAATDILKSLSDEQITQIKEARLVARASRNQERSKTKNEAVATRVQQIKRYLGFINFDLNAAQLADLRSTMNDRVKPEKPFGELRDELDADFYQLLEKREHANFDDLLVTYIDRRRQTLNDWGSKARSHNRLLWESYATRTINNLQPEQKIIAANYLKGLASTIKALSVDKPSYQKHKASEYTCLGRVVRS